MQLPFVSRETYEHLAADHQALQDRLRQYAGQNDYLRSALDEARRDATLGRELVCDWLALQVLGRKIFGTAPDLPLDIPNQEAIEKMAQSVPTGRSRADRMTERFIEEYKAKVEELKATQHAAANDSRR